MFFFWGLLHIHSIDMCHKTWTRDPEIFPWSSLQNITEFWCARVHRKFGDHLAQVWETSVLWAHQGVQFGPRGHSTQTTPTCQSPVTGCYQLMGGVLDWLRLLVPHRQLGGTTLLIYGLDRWIVYPGGNIFLCSHLPYSFIIVMAHLFPIMKSTCRVLNQSLIQALSRPVKLQPGCYIVGFQTMPLRDLWDRAKT